MSRTVFFLVLAGLLAGIDMSLAQTAEAGVQEESKETSGEMSEEEGYFKVNKELFVRQVASDAMVVTHTKPFPANSLVVVSDKGDLLLVDTPWTPEATKDLLTWLDKRFGPQKKQAVNTHFHLDALGGNPALRDARIGARGLVLTEELLRDRGEAMRQSLLDSLADQPEERKKFEEAELLKPPSRYMAGLFSLPLGRTETYELLYFGPSHSPDNLVVYFPERKLLFGGCVVKGGGSLGYLGDADLENWPKVIQEMMKLDAEIVVPGHGDRLDPGLLQNTLDLLEREAAGKSEKKADEEPTKTP